MRLILSNWMTFRKLRTAKINHPVFRRLRHGKLCIAKTSFQIGPCAPFTRASFPMARHFSCPSCINDREKIRSCDKITVEIVAPATETSSTGRMLRGKSAESSVLTCRDHENRIITRIGHAKNCPSNFKRGQTAEIVNLRRAG